MHPNKTVFSYALTASIGFFAFNIRDLFNPGTQSSAEQTIRDNARIANNNIKHAKIAEDKIAADLTAIDRLSKEAKIMLATAQQANDGSITALQLQKRQFMIASITDAKADFRRLELEAIQKFWNKALYGYDASYEEAKFYVVKARTIAVLEALDPTKLPEGKRQVLEAYKEEIIPQIYAASWGSSLGKYILETDIPTSLGGVLCIALGVETGGISMIACEIIADDLIDQGIDFIKQKYKEKFKNMPPSQAINCVKQAIETSLDQNTRNLLNPNLFGPYGPNFDSNFQLQGLESLFNNPGRTFDFATPFNQALDRCIEERNKEIEKKMEQLKSQQPNSSYRDKAGDGPRNPTRDNTPKESPPREPVRKEPSQKGPVDRPGPGFLMSSITSITTRQRC